jgi:hypothetical protein
MSEQQQQPLATSRSVRARRGTKMAALIAGAAAQDAQHNSQADDEFWSQAFFQDAADDAHYSTESESADEVDDDFFDPEKNDDDDDGDDGDDKNGGGGDGDAPPKKKKKTAYVDPRRQRQRAARGGAAAMPVEELAAVDASALPAEWQARIAAVDALTVRELRGTMSRERLDGARYHTRVQMARAIQHNLVRLHAEGEQLPAADEHEVAASEAVGAGVALRGTTKQRTEAIRAEMVVREAERERRRRSSLTRRVDVAAAAPLTQEQRLLEAKITERQNQAELARLTALHDDMRLQRAALARRKRHIVGPVVRVCSRADGGTTLAFTHPNIDVLFEPPPPPQQQRQQQQQQPPLASGVAAARERRRNEAAQHAADVFAKVEQLRALLAASHERAQALARRPLPAALAAPIVVATPLVRGE